MALLSFLKEPLQGRTSLARVFWLYGVAGSILYGALELFLDPGNEVAMRTYVIGGLLINVYVAVATFRCAVNCQSKFWGRMAQVSAVLALLLLPLIAYLDFSGGLTLAL